MVSSVTMPECSQENTYWGGVGRAYAALGPPLRPSAADIAFMESAAASWSATHRRPPRALLLGVTPQIAQMRWPPGASLVAADNSIPMMRAVWPGSVAGQRGAVCSNWPCLPLRASSRDLVLGDGSFSCLRYPNGFRAVAAEVRRVLRDDGMLILRCYIQPVQPERKEDLVADLLRGGIPSFHWFKYRLLMAMQQSTERGVPVDEVYRYWAGLNIDEAALVARTGWDAPGIRMIELYRGTPTVHTFSTLAEMRAVLGEFFEEIDISATSEVMGDRCPILLARPRSKPRRARRVSGVAECAV